MKTNLVPRELFSGCLLTDEQRKEFDYKTAEEIDDGSFFEFKGSVWDIQEFMVTQKDGALDKAGWSGISGQSAFHAVVVSISPNGEELVVGQVFS
ncbi:hypothetical protein HOV23_gp082 [Pseudomonas phage Lana]|uniref:Uncharacterized protein n=1 Tax=Pseudomonas phage Lana TaxID=2530172 RepID=A0A481W5X1_9CAUD|nr:hypothetical protein HOV23_gp082 [Pseudomonas phage Lana]QBJ04491.1 hypothetical protein [Pseudomonas phage Lana]